jgi:parvulin-like peptidyl-prolyl isomerase
MISFSTLFVFAQEEKLKDGIVAEVNGVKIKRSTLLKYHEQNLKVVQGNRTVDLNASLNDLIDRIIGIQKGKKSGVDKNPEVVKKMNDIIYHAYVSKEVSPLLEKIKVTDSDINNYYKENPEYRTSQILLKLRAIPSQDEVAAALEQSLRIYNELKNRPEKFEKLAQKYSQIATADNGGDIGYQPKVRLSPEYYEAIKGRNKGFISRPFRTQYGIHIVKVTGKKELKQIDRKLYTKILYDLKRDEILRDYFQKQRKLAKIKINKDMLEI